MKVTVIVSSPRRDGFGSRVAGRIAEGAESVGSDVEMHFLNDMRTFRQCQNCGGCKSNGGFCVLRDDVSGIIDGIRDADGVVFVTSISFNEVNGMFKILEDRLYCFLDANATTVMPKGKKVAVVVTAGADGDSAERVAEGLEKVMVQHFFCESVGRIAYNTWMMPKDMPVDDSVMSEAFEIGKRLS